jgi:glycosyltransferase involved in cell wall biosynthesis
MTINIQPHSLSQHLLLFDLSIYGHHPGYIRYLIEYWVIHSISGRLSMLVSPLFLTEHADVVQLTDKDNCHNVQFIAITPEEQSTLALRKSSISRNKRNFQEWHLFCQYAKKLQIDHALIMYLDTYQIQIALGFNAPCPISGIYFRPTFHYPNFSKNNVSQREKIQYFWERVLLNRVFQNKNFRHLLSLDPFVIPFIDHIPTWASALHLPDPVRLIAPPVDLDLKLLKLKKKLGIEDDRKIFLMFGALTARKGIYKVLEAMQLVSPEQSQKICLLLIGEADADNQRRIMSQVNTLRERLPVQIVCHYQFVPESDVQMYFYLSDVILATYQRHVGMSGILILAAAAQKIVLSSNYGLMGEIVRRYQLGLSLDSTNPREIAEGIKICLMVSFDTLGDRQEMTKFAQLNSDEQFSKTIYHALK